MNGSEICTLGSCSFGSNLVNGTCIIQNCAIYQVNNPMICLQCANGYYQSPSNPSICMAQNCQTYLQNSTQCQACIQFFTFSNGICIANYCNSWTNNSYCQQCIAGYQLINGLCKIQYCLSFNPENPEICATCLNGFALNSNGYCVPSNCQSYNLGQSICNGCLPGYVQEQNSCVLQDCFQFNNQYICQKCRPGFNLIIVNQTLICQKIYSTNCSYGYYFNSTYNQCMTIPIPNCRYMNEVNSQVCLSCIVGYYLSNGICYSISGCSLYSYITGCVNCINGFVLQGDLCVKDLCQQYFSSGVCQTCLSGYVLRNNTCLDYTSNCQSYQLNQTTNVGCLQCYIGYQLVNGLCYKLPDNCVSMDSTTNKCLQCASGYIQYSDSLCYKIISNCINQNGNYCSSCSNGYYLATNNTICIKIIPIYQCQTQDYVNNRCIQCNSGFQLVSNYTCIALNCA